MKHNDIVEGKVEEFIKGKVEEFIKKFLTDEIEKTVPLNEKMSGIVYKKKDTTPEAIVDWLRTALTEAHQAGGDEANKELAQTLLSLIERGNPETAINIIKEVALQDNK